MSTLQYETFQAIYNVANYLVLTPKWNFPKNKPAKLPLVITFFLYLIVFASVGDLLANLVISINNRANMKNTDVILLFLKTLASFLTVCSVIWSGRDKKWYELLAILFTKKQGFVKSVNIKIPMFGKVHFDFMLLQTLLIQIPTLIITICFFYSAIKRYEFLNWGMFLLYFLYSGFVSVLCNTLIIIRDEYTLIVNELKKNYHKMPMFFKMLQSRYRKTLQACDLVNDLYGRTLLFFIFLTTINLLVLVDALIDNVKYTSENISEIVLTITIGLFAFLFSVKISFACYSVETEAQQISIQCYILLEASEEPSVPENNDLVLLAMFTGNYLPDFSAGGFFSISRNTVLSVLASTLSYIIVLLQFKNMM